jgi:hypothetical protein
MRARLRRVGNWGEVSLWFATVACAVFAGPAWASLDFVHGWQALVAHSPAYEAVVRQSDAGQAKVDQAKALWRPQVLLGVGAGWSGQRTLVEGAGFTAPGFGSTQDVAFCTQVDSGLGTALSLRAQQPLVNSGRQASARQLEELARLAMARGQGLAICVADASVAIAQAEVDQHAALANWSLDVVGRINDERLRGDGPHASAGQQARRRDVEELVARDVRAAWLGTQSARAQVEAAQQAHQQAAAARHEWVRARLRLESLAGRLDEAALLKANDWLVPAPASKPASTTAPNRP